MRPLLALGVAVALLVGACKPAATTEVGTTGPVSTRVAIPSGLPVLGTWATTITRADLESAGITDPGMLNENTGRFTWSLDSDGTWRTVQVSLDDAPVLTPVFSGTFAVDGDAAVLVTTTFPEAYRDSGLRYTWQVNPDGSVTFRVPEPPDPVLRAVVETHPWRPASTP
jgi:hypothetical protein